ncbi:unnamed protein product [Lactuca virosa]|uniref:Uncharacterized protein n=1 Tax=Lactuca virosa TaxID=75947 RepID=A0AAU9N2S3_9ASTR|nr:unnamed protein product [Lactuca virosa]
MQIIIKFKSDRTAQVFKENKNIWLKCFNWLDHMGRKAVLLNTGPFWNRNDLSYGKLCILTVARKRINNEVNVVFDGIACIIDIIEIDDDWTPFKPFSSKSNEELDDEFDDNVDGVSDTWIQENTDLEDGEIDPKENDQAGGSPKTPMAANSLVGIRMDKTMHAHVENEETQFRESLCIDGGVHMAHPKGFESEENNCVRFNLSGSTPTRSGSQLGGTTVELKSPRPNSRSQSIGAQSSTEFELADFKKFICDAGILDLNKGGGRFTYLCDEGCKLSKMDRILVCSNFMSAFLNTFITALPREFSNHVLLYTHYMIFGAPPFRFYNSWMCRDECNSIVMQTWSSFNGGGAPDKYLSDKLHFVKNAIKLWRRAEFDKENSALLELKKLVNDLDMEAEKRLLTSLEIAKLKESRIKITDMEKLKKG